MESPNRLFLITIDRPTYLLVMQKIGHGKLAKNLVRYFQIFIIALLIIHSIIRSDISGLLLNIVYLLISLLLPIDLYVTIKSISSLYANEKMAIILNKLFLADQYPSFSSRTYSKARGFVFIVDSMESMLVDRIIYNIHRYSDFDYLCGIVCKVSTYLYVLLFIFLVFGPPGNVTEFVSSTFRSMREYSLLILSIVYFTTIYIYFIAAYLFDCYRIRNLD